MEIKGFYIYCLFFVGGEENGGLERLLDKF